MKPRIKPSCLKSFGDVRSQTRYHLVYGIGSPLRVGKVGWPAIGEDTDVVDAGDESGAPGKSAKSNES